MLVAVVRLRRRKRKSSVFPPCPQKRLDRDRPGKDHARPAYKRSRVRREPVRTAAFDVISCRQGWGPSAG
jgi:hypothetical protein